jgi:hypothetical protein
MIALLLVLTATFHPARPAVGDLITIDFPRAPVVLDASPAYEIVSQQGSRAVIRTFQPKPFAIGGRAGNVAFRNMVVPVRSVLAPKDSFEPAPLRPPIAEPYEKLPFVLIAIAAVLAIAAWASVVALAKRVRVKPPAMAHALSPHERFVRTVTSLRKQPQPLRWAALADALRAYLDATSPFSADLTTTELLARVHDADVAAILHAGDLEKFAPQGTPDADFDQLSARALRFAEAPR